MYRKQLRARVKEKYWRNSEGQAASVVGMDRQPLGSQPKRRRKYPLYGNFKMKRHPFLSSRDAA